jgi:hypothetical protein
VKALTALLMADWSGGVTDGWIDDRAYRRFFALDFESQRKIAPWRHGFI